MSNQPRCHCCREPMRGPHWRWCRRGTWARYDANLPRYGIRYRFWRRGPVPPRLSPYLTVGRVERYGQ